MACTDAPHSPPSPECCEVCNRGLGTSGTYRGVGVLEDMQKALRMHYGSTSNTLPPGHVPVEAPSPQHRRLGSPRSPPIEPPRRASSGPAQLCARPSRQLVVTIAHHPRTHHAITSQPLHRPSGAFMEPSWRRAALALATIGMLAGSDKSGVTQHVQLLVPPLFAPFDDWGPS